MCMITLVVFGLLFKQDSRKEKRAPINSFKLHVSRRHDMALSVGIYCTQRLCEKVVTLPPPYNRNESVSGIKHSWEQL